MKLKLVNLTKKDGNAKRFTPQDALQTVMDDYKSGHLKGTKIVIIALDDTEGSYHVDRTMAGLHGDEAVSVIEAAKYLILKETFE